MTGELLTVKEYAARQGITEQAAYKQIRTGKLETVERQENGKAKKYIFVFAQGDPETPFAAAEAQPEPQKAPAQDQTIAALDNVIAALTAQLEERDRHINRLTELLSQSQQLQAHNQKLLEQYAQQPEPVQEPESEPQAEPAPRKNRSFWEWLSSI